METIKTDEQVNKESNENYIHSMELWNKGQLRIISGLEITSHNADKMIKHFEAVAELDTEQKEHEKKYHASVLANLREWCEHNNIPIPDWAL